MKIDLDKSSECVEVRATYEADSWRPPKLSYVDRSASYRAKAQLESLVTALKLIHGANAPEADATLVNEVLVLENEFTAAKERAEIAEKLLNPALETIATQKTEILELRAQIVLLKLNEIPATYFGVACRALYESGFSGDEERNEQAVLAVYRGMIGANRGE